MSKITDYLNENLSGEVVSTTVVRDKFSRDSSILAVAPSLVVHPRTTDDLRKVARFSWRLSEKGQHLPLTVRGGGSDVSGAAIGDGLVLAMPSHMSEIMEFESKSRLVRVQAGCSIYALQQAMSISGLWLPVENGLTRINTIGGAISNNAISDRFLRYGSIGDWVQKLEVVLPNGEIIQTERLSRRELNEKKGLQSLEGEVYRSVDSLIEDNAELINSLAEYPSLDGSGYAIEKVKGDDGSFDLTPLFVGAQGTLGSITQAILQLTPQSSLTGVVCASLPRNIEFAKFMSEISSLEPSMLYLIDADTLAMIYEYSGVKSWSGVTESLPDYLVIVGFEDKNPNRKLRKAGKMLNNLNVEEAVLTEDEAEIDGVMTIIDSLAVVTNYNDGKSVSTPVLPAVSVPTDILLGVMSDIRGIMDELRLPAGISSNLGAGLIVIRPIVNLANLSDRQALLRAIDKISELVAGCGGSLTGLNRGGRLLSSWAGSHHDKEASELFAQIKKIFDPYNIMNPGVQDRTVDRTDLVESIVKSYSPDSTIQFNLRG